MTAYRLCNPTGNITALVTDPVPAEERVALGDRIMQKESACEQVGFLSNAPECDLRLDMAGGEFCGNATLSAAAVWMEERKLETETPRLRVSGCDTLLPVDMTRIAEHTYRGNVSMPLPERIRMVDLAMGPQSITLPGVFFPGIVHLIADAETLFRSEAEQIISTWCDWLDVPALGIMLMQGDTMSPLVYVKSADTLFWESSCASGTTAVAAWRFFQNGVTETVLQEPAGTLSVSVTHIDSTVTALTLTGSVNVGTEQQLD